MQRTNDPDHNLDLLKQNSYPGRIIIVGVEPDGTHLVQLNALTGRGDNSRNRLFEYSNGTLKTVPADPDRVTDPTHIIYNAMREYRGRYIVSNGKQTDVVYEGLQNLSGFRAALETCDYERDGGNAIPRISAVCSLQPLTALFSIIRRNPDNAESVRDFYAFQNTKEPKKEQLTAGLGYCVHTFEGDGHPLPSFKDGPYLVPLQKNGDELLREYWNVLPRDNRVAIALKRIEIKSGISSISVINRYEKVAA